MSQNVAAIVVLYNPQVERLSELFASLNGQVKSIIAVNNSELITDDCKELLSGINNLIHRELGGNRGIAAAQNQGIDLAETLKHTHVLLLDQDSVLAPGFVEQLLSSEMRLVKAGKKVAAVGPLYVEQKNATKSFAIRYGWLVANKNQIDSNELYIQSDCLIASGALIRISVFREIGKLLEDLFIDCVDTEWCIRALKTGWECFIIPRAVMQHSIGDEALKFMGRNVTLHNDTRHYYMIRNAIYLVFSSKMSLKWKIHVTPRIPFHMILYAVKSKEPLNATMLILRAALDGVTGRLGPLIK